MRLIDADVLIKVIRKQSALSLTKGMIEQFIKSQPTAYDVDKVVEQLDKMQVYQFQGKLPDGRVCHFSDAIEIVKTGEKDEIM